MKQIRKRLTYANVMSSLAVFLVLGGATAFAASQLAKNSVGSKQLKKNAVTTKKIKKNAVTAAKIKNGAVSAPKIATNAVTGEKIAASAVTGEKIAASAVTGEKIADGSVTGADINAGSTPFSQLAARLRTTAAAPFTPSGSYGIGTYVQPAGETIQFIGALDVNFPASCAPPRSAQAFLLDNPANPASPTANDIVGLGVVSDSSVASVTRRLEFVPLVGGVGATRLAPSAATPHALSVFLSGVSCNSGGGVSVVGAGVDVIGTK